MKEGFYININNGEILRVWYEEKLENYYSWRFNQNVTGIRVNDVKEFLEYYKLVNSLEDWFKKANEEEE